MPTYTHQLYGSIDQVPVADWDGLLRRPDDALADRRFLRAVEGSMAGEANFWYLLVRDEQGQAVALASYSLYHVDGVLMAGKWLQAVVQCLRRVVARLLKFRILLVGVPVSVAESHVRLAESADAAQILTIVDQVAVRLAREQRLWLIAVKEASPSDLPVTDGLISLGYLRADSLPMNMLDTRASSYDELVAQMRSHYRYKINKSRKRFAAAGMRVEQLTDAREMLQAYDESVHALYEAVTRRAETVLETLPREFFLDLVRQMPHATSLTVVREPEQGRIVACAWGLFGGAAYHNLFVGVDDAVSDEVHLYFNLMIENLDYGLSLRPQELFVGQTADTFKSRIGCYQQPRYFYVKSVGRPLAVCLRALGRWLFPPAQVSPQRDLFKTPEPNTAGTT